MNSILPSLSSKIVSALDGKEKMLVALGGAHVLKKKSYASLTQAQGILKEAHTQADGILKKAHLEAISIKKQALKEAQQQWKDTRVKRSFLWARRCVHALCLLEKDVVMLIQNTLQKVMGEVSQEKLINHVVKSLLLEYKDHTHVMVKVAPSQKMLVIKGLGSDAQVRVVGDENIAQGSCRLEGPLGIIEGGLKHTMESLKKQMEQICGAQTPLKEETQSGKSPSQSASNVLSP